MRIIVSQELCAGFAHGSCDGIAGTSIPAKLDYENRAERGVQEARTIGKVAMCAFFAHVDSLRIAATSCPAELDYEKGGADMAEDKRRYKATIAGRSYTLIGPGSTAHFDAVTQILNDQLAQIHRLQPNLSREDAAMLLAFNALSDQVTAATTAQQD